MSGIVAVFNRRGQPVESGILKLMCDAVPEHAVDGQDMWLSANVGLAHQHFWVTPEEQGEHQPLVDKGLGLAVTADVRLDNRTELIRTLIDDQVGVPVVSDARLILLAYAKWGERCVEHLLGDFAFAIWDTNHRQLFLARDAMGGRGLVYWQDKNICCAATDISHLLAHPSIPARLNEERIADYLRFNFANQTSSFYAGILHCPPAHCLLVTEQEFRMWRYWDFDPDRKIYYRRDEEYAEHLRMILTEAVQCRLRANGPAALSLSGGLDSSSLAAILANSLSARTVDNPQVRTFSYVFNKIPSSDERVYIEETVKRHDLNATYIPCDGEWTLRNVDEWPVLRDYVNKDPYARLPDTIARSASDAGCRVLLTGFFGDSLFDGGRFWLLDMLRGGRYVTAASTLINDADEINRQRLVINDGVYRLIPRWAKNILRSQARRPINDGYPWISSEFSRRIASMPTATNITDTKEAHALFAARRRSLSLSVFAQGRSATRKLYARYAVELALPYWDRRMAEYVMALPADQLGRPRRDRYVLRNAMTGLVSEAVLSREVRTVFVPLMQKGLRDYERNTVERILTDPLIVRYGFIDSSWLQEAKQQLSNWGESLDWLWYSICLELWLRRYW